MTLPTLTSLLLYIAYLRDSNTTSCIQEKIKKKGLTLFVALYIHDIGE